MATTSKTKSFEVTCPHCHDSEATVTLNLNDLAECFCSGCDETFSVQKAIVIAAAELARWQRVARWVEMAEEL